MNPDSREICFVTTLGIPGVPCHNDPGVHEETGPGDLASPGRCYPIIWPNCKLAEVKLFFFFFKISGPDVMLPESEILSFRSVNAL